MSTRATYKFEDRATTTIYIHYDGYPQGAAVYFNQMLTNPSKGDLATQFIRANQNAEITKSHKDHGDTEFHYDIKGSNAEADIWAYSVNQDTKEKICVYSGKLYDFINSHSNLIDNFKPYKRVKLLYGAMIHNETTAGIALRNPLGHLQIWKGKYENSSNWNSCVEEVNNIVNIFPELKTEEVLEFVS